MKDNKLKKPFELSYTFSFSELLYNLNSSLMISTYQAEKVIVLSAPEPNKLIQLPRNFETPMGIAYDGNRLAIASKTTITTFGKMNKTILEQKNDIYDACFIPTASFYTGFSHLHDIAFGEDKLYAVNTNFSLIGSVNIDYNFTPYWKPFFIDEINGEDQCHLNGMAMENSKPRYVTLFSATSKAKGWKETDFKQGMLIDIETNEILVNNIFIPHSPRLHNGKLYFLESATRSLKSYDFETKEVEDIIKLHGFTRGLDLIGEFAFIGISKIRASSKGFATLDIAKQDYNAAVVAIHIPTKSVIGGIEYISSVEELYDVKILPNTKRPNIIGLDEKQFNTILMPNSGYWID